MAITFSAVSIYPRNDLRGSEDRLDPGNIRLTCLEPEQYLKISRLKAILALSGVVTAHTHFTENNHIMVICAFSIQFLRDPNSAAICAPTLTRKVSKWRFLQ